MNPVLKWTFESTSALGLALLTFQLVAYPSLALRTHLAELEKQLRFLRWSLRPGAHVFITVLLLAASGVAGTIGSSLFFLLFVGLAFAWLRLPRAAAKRRTEQIDLSIDSWLVALIGALEAAPSLGEALKASCGLARGPLREEILETLAEVELGRPIGAALIELGRRSKSRKLELLLGTLEVGRVGGGNLPEALRNMSGALAEMARLEGVLRTKTAEGRAQAWVVSAVPLPLYLAVRHIDPEYFRPLDQHALGQGIYLLAGVCWLGAILAARRILAVDL